MQPWGMVQGTARVQRALLPSWAAYFFFFFGCTEWKILAHGQNRCCEEECSRAKPHHAHRACTGKSFYCGESPQHSSWKSSKVKSPLCFPTTCPGGQGRVRCVATCLSRYNWKAVGSQPPALKLALFYDKHPSCHWQVVTTKKKA